MSMKRGPEEVLFEALLLGDSGQTILNQEKRGQQDLQQYDVLPIDSPRDKLESLGFWFGEYIDDLFIECKLPEGWKKVPTNHSMWTDLIDDRGRCRAGIFYKAAFYDRSAHMRLNRRFSYSSQPVGGWEQENYRDKPFFSVVSDNGNIVWYSEEHACDDYPLADQHEKEARLWLDEHYPNWENDLAYWEE